MEVSIINKMTIEQWRAGLTAQDKLILSFSKERKLDLIRSMREKNEFGIFMQFSKILLDAPISEGGISTEEITEAWEGK